MRLALLVIVAQLALPAGLLADLPPGPRPRPAFRPDVENPPGPPIAIAPVPEKSAPPTAPPITVPATGTAPAPLPGIKLIIIRQGAKGQPASLWLPGKLVPAGTGSPAGWDFPSLPGLSLLIAGTCLVLALLLAARRLGRRGWLILGPACGLVVMVMVGVSGCPAERIQQMPYQRRQPTPLACKPDGLVEGEALLRQGPEQEVRLRIDPAVLDEFLTRAGVPGGDSK